MKYTLQILRRNAPGEKPVWKQTGEGLEIQTREVRSESPVFFRITCR